MAGIGVEGGERERANQQHGVEQVKCDQEAAGDGDVVACESCEDGARADEGFEQEKDGGNYGERQEAGQVVPEADGFNEQPDAHQQGYPREGGGERTQSRWQSRGRGVGFRPGSGASRGRSRRRSRWLWRWLPGGWTIMLTDRVVQARTGAFIGAGLARFAMGVVRVKRKSFL